MKKIVLTLIGAVVTAQFSFAQNTFPSTGNAGIGTTSPSEPLVVTGSAGAFSSTAHVISQFAQDLTNQRGVYLGYDGSGQIGIVAANSAGAASNLAFWNYSGTGWLEAMRLTSGGNLGIGTTSPVSRLNLAGGGNPNPNTGSEIDYGGLNLTFTGINTGGTFNLGTIKLVQSNSYYVDHADMVFYTAPGGGSNTEKMRITGGGNVLIGKTSQNNSGYILDVAGSARINQVTVNTSGADFVFAPKYKLMPLTELGRFVDKNHHLPGIEPAKDMQANGMNLGDTQTKLLQKVEELTLYLIKKDRQLADAQKELSEEKQKKREQDVRLKKVEAEVQTLIRAKQQ